MSTNKIGCWHRLDKKKLLKIRQSKTSRAEKKTFIKNLYKIGYPKNLNIKTTKHSAILTTAFQRRFRQNLINGVIDQECLSISENLLKKLK